MFAPESFDQLLHLDPGQRIERAERLVEQQQARLVDQRASQRDALLLPAGQGRRPLVGTLGQADRPQRLQGLRPPVAAQAEADVVDHPLPRQQARVLEHQPGVLAGLGQRRRAGQQLAAAGLVEAGQQAQQGALAAAAAANDSDELPGRNQQVDVLEHLALAEAPRHSAQGQRDTALEALRSAAKGGVVGIHAPPPLTW